jgi:hypothetical protein
MPDVDLAAKSCGGWSGRQSAGLATIRHGAVWTIWGPDTHRALDKSSRLLWPKSGSFDTLTAHMKPFTPSIVVSAGTPITAAPLVSIAELGSITEALAVVHALGVAQQARPELLQAVQAIKRAQCQRFRQSYSDVLAHADWAQAARFFLNELYGDRDFSQRDAQFARIAQAMQRLFPQSVVSLATALTHLHALSEQLDHAMGCAILQAIPGPISEVMALNAYVDTWRAVGHPSARAEQLALVLRLGEELSKLTRTTGLRMMLRMMRGPAHAAGLQHLQAFLEEGFDTFSALQRSKSGVAGFLALVAERESAWIDRLFDTAINANGRDLWPELE